MVFVLCTKKKRDVTINFGGMYKYLEMDYICVRKRMFIRVRFILENAINCSVFIFTSFMCKYEWQCNGKIIARKINDRDDYIWIYVFCDFFPLQSILDCTGMHKSEVNVAKVIYWFIICRWIEISGRGGGGGGISQFRTRTLSFWRKVRFFDFSKLF